MSGRIKFFREREQANETRQFLNTRGIKTYTRERTPSTVYATEIDTTLVSSGPSTSVTFTVDTVPPATPVISAPGATVVTSTFTISGTAELGSTVYVYANSTAGALLGTAITSGVGTWALVLSSYVNGPYTFAATTHDKASNISGATSRYR